METLDRIFDTVSRQLPEAGIDCLLIGGFAVNQYGYTRNTLDVDFMIVTHDLDKVRGLMRDAGFSNVDARDNVAFFSIPDEGPRVDFLLVDKSTMTELLGSAVAVVIRNHTLHVPSLKHLIAMKIFALSQSTTRRMGKDLPDIAYLSVMNGLSPEEDIKPLCDQYGTPDVYHMIQAQIRGLRDS